MPTITKLLVANRGEIASRVIRAARSMGISTVAIFSDTDEQLPYVVEADEAYRLAGSAPADTYLHIDRILAVARRAGADAVHPGYGFLSENADFARACAARKIVFVGPTVEAIELMGSKIGAKRLMAAAGVPVLPGVAVTSEMDPGALESAVTTIGFPVLVKAAFGGGGRGMHIVRSPATLATAVATAEREARSAFGDGTVFIERLIDAPRHVEIQIFGDTQGDVVHLFERDCSIQRRHQKVIEEAPSPAVDEKLRYAMGEAAVAAGKAIGYVGAGTVEFVLDHDHEFFFLEVNTRLQVEHPVTEMVTGLDLVQLQLAVAQGAAIPDEVRHASMQGHAIEARLYAEDVGAGFLPVSGRIERLQIATAPAVRVDSGYRDGSFVSTFYDAMLAKVIAWAPTRTAAAERLADALATAQIHGVVTNRDLLVATLRHPEFRAGLTDTAFYERHDPAELARATDDPQRLEAHAIAAAVCDAMSARQSAPVPAGIPIGWRNVGPADQVVILEHEAHAVAVRLNGTDEHLTVSVDGSHMHARLWSIDPSGVDLEIDGTRRRYAINATEGLVYVDSAMGATQLRMRSRFPKTYAPVAVGSLLSPFPGTVVAIAAEVGATVVAGQALLALEAMKMEHVVRAPHGGTISEIHARIGDQVNTGTVLAVVEAIETDAP